MVEPILFILSGVFACSIAALFIGHALWKRTVKLTTQRVLRHTPVSKADIVAAGDLIRAEHAVQMVRVERKLHAATAKASEYLAEIGRKIVSNTELKTDLKAYRTLCTNKQANIDVLTSNLDHMQNALAKTLSALTTTRDKLNEATASLKTTEQRFQHLESINKQQKNELAALESTIVEIKQQMLQVSREALNTTAALQQEKSARENAEKQILLVKTQTREDMATHLGELEAQLERLKVEKAMLEGVVSSVRSRKRKAVAAARAETAALLESMPHNNGDAMLDRPELPNMSDVHILTNRLAARQSKKMIATAANDTDISSVASKK